MDRKDKQAAFLGAAGAVTAGRFLYKKYLTGKTERIDGSGQTALITGASGGIGKELAVVFAEHRFDLILVARNAEKLEALNRSWKPNLISASP